MMNLTSDIAKIHTLLSHIENGAPRAINGALNRTIDGVRTDIVNQVKNNYDIKPTKIRAALKVTHSKPATLQASVNAKGEKIPLVQFRVSPNKPGQQSDDGIRVSVKRSGGKQLPNAFVASANGRVGVFERIDKSRLPIKELNGPAVAQMVNEPTIQKYILDGAGERFSKRADHEIDRLLSGFDSAGKWE